MKHDPASRFLLLVLLGILLGGCATIGGGNDDAGEREEEERRADGLLARADLQALVDAQVLRDEEPLITALDANDPLIRARAAFALASVQSEAAITRLLPRLADDHPAVRADAAFALGQIGDEAEARTLIEALRREGTVEVQRELLTAIGKTGGESEMEELLTLNIPEALEPDRALSLARFGMREIVSRRSVELLLDALSGADPATAENAAYAFSRLPADEWRSMADRVRATVPSLSPLGRAHAARALSRLEDKQDIGLLTHLIQHDEDWRVRSNAAMGLLPHTNDATFPTDLALLAVLALDDDSPHVRYAAATLVGGMQPPTGEFAATAIEWIETHPDDDWTNGALLPVVAQSENVDFILAWMERQDNPFAKASAFRALGGSDDPRSLTVLLDASRHEDPRLAAAAIEALGQRWRTIREAVTSTERRQFFDAFAEATRRRDLATTTTAAPFLADSVFTPLDPGTILRDTYREMQAPEDIEPMVAIVETVGKIRDGEEIEFLIDVAMSGHPVVRESAVNAMNGRLEEGIEVSTRGEVASQTLLIDWEWLASFGRHPHLLLSTDRGTVTIELDAEHAPQTVYQIARVVTRGDYDGVPFHRIVPNFVVQGGDYFREDGYGGPETPIRSEFTRILYDTGTVGMASAGKDTEGVQYFITHSPQPHLDGRYTAFGRVIRGQDVVDRLVPGDVVKTARLTKRPE